VDKLIRFHHLRPRRGIVFYPQYFVLMHELVEELVQPGTEYRLRPSSSGSTELGLARWSRLECEFLASDPDGATC